MGLKTILVSQPRPKGDKSPYFDLAKKYDLKIDFRSFIHVEGIEASEFRDQKIDLKKHTAVIMTSKIAVDHYFRILEEYREPIDSDAKYFCLSETVALYLQKYIPYRKRKIFFGKQTISDLEDTLKKFKKEKFLLPCSNILRDRIPNTLDKLKLDYQKAVLYRTVASDLSDLSDVKYDMLVFYSPGGIESLLKNFPDFKQGNTLIAAFGATTANAIVKHNLRLDLHAPQPNMPSMTSAIEHYIKNERKKEKKAG